MEICQWCNGKCKTSKESITYYEFRSYDGKLRYSGWFGPECAYIASEKINEYDFNQE
jgi:hypothetical protein